MMSAFEASAVRWRNVVEFACTYVVQAGDAATYEAAIAGDFTPEAPIHGVIHRRGRQARLSKYPQVAAKVTKGKRSGQMVDFGWEQIVTDELQLDYFPSQGGVGASLVFAAKPDSTLDHEFQGVAAVEFNPFRFHGGNDGKLPLRVWIDGSKVELTTTLDKVDDQHVEVVQEYRAPNGDVFDRRIRFWTEPSVPLLVRSDVRRLKGGEFRMTTIASDFVDCGGVFMAKRLLRAVGPVTTRSGDAVWGRTEWKSADLGDRSPVTEDFVLEVPAGVVPRGLRNYSISDTPTPVNLADYTVADLLKSGEPVPPPRRAAQPPSSWRFRGILVMGGLIGIVIALFVLSRRANDS